MTYAVSVRALCEFAAKQGDLDLRFTPAPTARQGQRGHALAAARRGSAYRTELALSAALEGLLVRGRADGYDAAAERLDEFKTFRGDLSRMKANHRVLHWAQLRCYGAMLCKHEGRSHVGLALVYFDIESQHETILAERGIAHELIAWFAELCGRFAAWAASQVAHRQARDAALRGLKFPHAAFHAGQRVLAEAVYKAAYSGQCVLAQAPTGIGKTMGTLFPSLKALEKGRIDRIFYLAAKTTGRHLALAALARLQDSGQHVPLRVVDLVAREKACVYPDRACHGDSCPLARGFYDRLAGARTAALQCRLMDQASLRAVAEAHRLCPYYLSLEMVRWADVVVGDYHYYFDESGLLFGLQSENEWRIALLVDEAHNLIERGRAMYSMQLTEGDLHAAIESSPPVLTGELRRLARAWTGLCAAQTAPYTVVAPLPVALMGALKHALQRLTEFAALQVERMDGPLERFYFDALRFCKLAESFGEHFLFDIRGTTLCIRNVAPAPFFKNRLAAAHCSILFSATLSPCEYYRNMLGVPKAAWWLDVPTPFRAAQLEVRVSRIATRWRRRPSSLVPVCSLIGRQHDARPGNYLVFASSFDYLQALYETFAERSPHISSWRQHPNMSEVQRREFIARFMVGGRGVGFAVLGGAFAEGVDLPGERLIGAFIATLGMPQVNPVNDALAQRLQALFGAGHEYVYLYPGLQKVTQAAGRVIRSTEDRGTLYLIDERYAHPAVWRRLPSWWIRSG